MPSYSELTAVVGFRSKNAVYKLVQRIVAREWAGRGEGSLQVAVRVSLPFIGLLLAYEGSLKREDLKQ